VITGIAGQDGSYLAELLLAKGYEVRLMVDADIALLDDELAGRLVRVDRP
jgi:GDP-D-mannose dehydratase